MGWRSRATRRWHRSVTKQQLWPGAQSDGDFSTAQGPVEKQDHDPITDTSERMFPLPVLDFLVTLSNADVLR